MYSAKWVLWASVATNVICTLLTPVAANFSYIAVLVVRFIAGLGSVYNQTNNAPIFSEKYHEMKYIFSKGVSMPATHVMLSKWALPEERNAISSFTLAGKW